MTETCRCGHLGEGPHPCHGMKYTCKAPAQQRFYNLRPASLAGMQMKFSAESTWACDQCWEFYQNLLKAQKS